MDILISFFSVDKYCNVNMEAQHTVTSVAIALYTLAIMM